MATKMYGAFLIVCTALEEYSWKETLCVKQDLIKK
jgi:hypothetical protein